jgi:8-oxo-dGTP pyrophosphatase MutT (NUDIX family)
VNSIELLSATDQKLARSQDPAQSRLRIEQGTWINPDCDREREQILELLTEHGAALADRTTMPGHLTGSALVVNHARTHVLLLFHSKLQRWLQPGGHADGDHDLAAVALREATEETGIAGLAVLLPAVDVDIHRIPALGDMDSHLHLDLRFVVVAPDGASAIRNHESEELRWVTPQELEELSDEPGLIRLCGAGLSALEQYRSSVETQT